MIHDSLKKRNEVNDEEDKNEAILVCSEVWKELQMNSFVSSKPRPLTCRKERMRSVLPQREGKRKNLTKTQETIQWCFSIQIGLVLFKNLNLGLGSKLRNDDLESIQDS